MTSSRLNKLVSFLGRPRLGWWLALLALAVMLPALWIGYLSDDFIVKVCLQGCPSMPEVERSPFDVFSFCPGDPASYAQYQDRGVLAWWAPSGFRFAFWRPLASLSHWFDISLYPNLPSLAHLHSLLWYAAVAVAAAALYRRLFSMAWVAGLAALLYVLDDAHAFPVAWIANRNGVMGALFGILVLLMHDRWRRDGWLPGVVCGVVLLGIGLACGESTVAATGYIAAYALFLDRGNWMKRLATLLPYVLPVLAWIVVYRAIGCGTTGSGQYVDPVREPLPFLKEAIVRLPILVAAQMAVPSASLWPFVPAWAAYLHLAVALSCVAFMAWVLWPMIKHEPLARFWTLGMLLSMLPFCATYPCDRLLFLPGLGGMGLVAQFFGLRRDPPAWLRESRAQRAPGRVLAISWIAIHGVLSPLSMPGGALSPLVMGKSLVRAANSFPHAPEVTQQNVIVINSPADYLMVFTPFKLVSDGFPIPRRTLTLSVGLQGFTLERPDEKNLVFHAETGLFSDGFTRTMRGPGYPITPGFKAHVPGIDVEVRETTPDGHPTVFACAFDIPLEDPSLRFIIWQGKGYVPFTLPNVGETCTVPPTSWFWAF